MALEKWEAIVQQIVDESNQEPTAKGKHRLIMRWRVKLEKEPPHVPLHQIDEIVWEVRKRLETTVSMQSATTASDMGLPSGLPISPNSEPIEIDGRSNLFAGLTQKLPDELVQTLLQAKNLRIERIISHGHASPDGFWYDQDQNEWVVVLRGAARLGFEDETFELKPGDFINIPAHKKHRVEWTTPDGPTIWLAVFYG